MAKHPILPIKKTKQTQAIKTWYEHLAINDKWVRIDIVIDYAAMTVSIVEPNRNNKSYMFCWRSLSYQQWRTNILEAIQTAMDIWFAKLREREDKDLKDMADKLIATTPNL